MIEIASDIDEVLSQIRSGKTGRDRVIVQLYHDQNIREGVINLIKRNGGQDNDFDLVFNTTLMQLIKSVIKNRELKISTTLPSYIIGVAKYVWINEFKKGIKNKTEDLDSLYDVQGEERSPEKLLIDMSKKNLLSELLGKLGRNCKEVLMHWASGYNMNEIADMMEYKSDMMARKKKYKCFKELLDYLERNPEIKKVLR